MTGGVFVGRPRPLWKVILYSLLTLGVYGRVHLYKSAKEIDGHEALFLDLRLWLLGVILPVGGPLVVKWRLVRHLQPMVRHDATAPRMHPKWLRAAAFLPLIPLYHALVQRHLSHHWTLHRKIADLEAREEVLEQRRASARTDADRDEVRRLEADLQLRADALKQAREAAVEIREAKRARARAEAEIRAAGGAPSPLQRIKKIAPLEKLKRRRATEPSPEEPVAAPEAPTAEPAPRLRPERAPSAREATAATPDPADPSMSKGERKALTRYLEAKAKREKTALEAHEKQQAKARKAAQKAGQPEPPPEPVPPSEPSRKESKWLARYDREREKRERAQVKAAEKAARKEEKARAAGPTSAQGGRKGLLGFLGRRKGEDSAASPEPMPESAPATPEPAPEEPAPAAAPEAKPAKPRGRARARK